MDKTVTVKVGRLVKHPLYGKYVRRFTTVKAHDPDNTARVGDRIEVEFCRPLSKTKRWRFTRIIRAAHRGVESAEGSKGQGSSRVAGGPA